MRKIALDCLCLAALGAVLAGCAAGIEARSLPEQPLADEAPADDIYLDGTGPTARAAQPEPARRADDVSASTAGSRAASREGQKPFTEQWWEKERREDARLKARMNICRGC